MKINTNPVRGTRDFGPQEMELRDYVTDVIMKVYRRHGFTRIQTPILENINFVSCVWFRTGTEFFAQTCYSDPSSVIQAR